MMKLTYLDEIDQVPFLHDNINFNPDTSRPYYLRADDSVSYQTMGYYSFFGPTNKTNVTSPLLTPQQLQSINDQASPFDHFDPNQQYEHVLSQLSTSNNKFNKLQPQSAEIDSNLDKSSKNKSQTQPLYQSTVRPATISPLDQINYPFTQKLTLPSYQPQQLIKPSPLSYTNMHTTSDPLIDSIDPTDSAAVDDNNLEVALATIFTATIEFRLPSTFTADKLNELFNGIDQNTIFYNSYQYSLKYQLLPETIYSIDDEQLCYQGLQFGHSCPQLCPINTSCKTDFDCNTRYCNQQTAQCDLRSNRDDLLSQIIGRNATRANARP